LVSNRGVLKSRVLAANHREALRLSRLLRHGMPHHGREHRRAIWRFMDMGDLALKAFCFHCGPPVTIRREFDNIAPTSHGKSESQ
jgi:hypothetical protein